MSVHLGPELRARIWPELDWAKAAPNLASSISASESLSADAKAPFLRQLAELCEFCVLDPQVAADLYGAAFKADRSSHDVLESMRTLCEAMGRFDLVARTAELQFRQTQEQRFHAMAGQAWLDAGEPDRALKPLLAANSAAPGNRHVAAALEVARREWASPEEHAEELIERARTSETDSSLLGLQAARILNLLDFDDDRYEEALQLCLQSQPNLPSACNLLEVLLLEHERHHDLARHFLVRAQAASSPNLAVELLFKGSSLLLRVGQYELGASLFSKAIGRAVDAGTLEARGLLAILRAIVASPAEGRYRALEDAEAAFDLIASKDEKVGLAIFCGQIAWYAQKDFEAAQRWMDRLRANAGEHNLLVDFELASAILKADTVMDEVGSAVPPVPEEDEKRRAPRLAIVANIEIKIEYRDRMGIVSKQTAVTRDISTVGAQLKCDKELKLDQVVEAVLHLPSSSGLSKRRFSVKARVARIIPGRGFGVEWIDAPYEFRNAIATLPKLSE